LQFLSAKCYNVAARQVCAPSGAVPCTLRRLGTGLRIRLVGFDWLT
jgi:hypothetical protein